MPFDIIIKTIGLDLISVFIASIFSFIQSNHKRPPSVLASLLDSARPSLSIYISLFEVVVKVKGLFTCLYFMFR